MRMPHSYRNRVRKADKLLDEANYCCWLVIEEPWRKDLPEENTFASIHIMRAANRLYRKAKALMEEAAAIRNRLKVLV